MQQKLAVIGGSGLFDIQGLGDVVEHIPQTPYGDPSAPVLEGRIGNGSVLFLSRHGRGRHLPPHGINYRANLWALKSLGASDIVAINIVGGISPAMAPGSWVVPDQIIDYTWGRKHSIYDATSTRTEHIDFTEPYDDSLSGRLIAAAAAEGLAVLAAGTYGCTQGPRLESAAEIRRLQRDGCDIVGMTAMPEAALARELAISYSSLCLVVNWAAGCAGQTISFDNMQAVVTQHMPRAIALLARLVD
jgi:5'-deoxy-5'-methylthioadenosine phosphorylase